MKAIIGELFNTGIQIIKPDSFINEITCFGDLKKCENVIVSKKNKEVDWTTVSVDSKKYNVIFKSMKHPSGFGTVCFCEINK